MFKFLPAFIRMPDYILLTTVKRFPLWYASLSF